MATLKWPFCAQHKLLHKIDPWTSNVPWGEFHKSWTHGVKRRAYPKLSENEKVESKALNYDAKLE